MNTNLLPTRQVIIVAAHKDVLGNIIRLTDEHEKEWDFKKLN